MCCNSLDDAEEDVLQFLTVVKSSEDRGFDLQKQEKMGITNYVEEGMVEEKATGTNFPHLDLHAATAWSSVGGWRQQEKKGMDR